MVSSSIKHICFFYPRQTNAFTTSVPGLTFKDLRLSVIYIRYLAKCLSSLNPGLSFFMVSAAQLDFFAAHIILW